MSICKRFLLFNVIHIGHFSLASDCIASKKNALRKGEKAMACLLHNDYGRIQQAQIWNHTIFSAYALALYSALEAYIRVRADIATSSGRLRDLNVSQISSVRWRRQHLTRVGQL